MQRPYFSFLLIFLSAVLTSCQTEPYSNQQEDFRQYEPDEYFSLVRAYPDATFSFEGYTRGLKEAKTMVSLRSEFPGFQENWAVRGPGNLGARVNTIAIHPQNEDIIFAGFARGGVWRTQNGGDSWEPVFDEQLFPAVGDIEIDPSNPSTIYVGTGDPNISAHPGIGDGLYRSTDGGDTWTHLGLTEQRIISRVLVSPQDPNLIYAAAMGIPFERNTERGLYRSADGGQSWEQILFISDQAGVIDLAMHPDNPNILYASGWDRVRNNQESLISGEGAKVYKTVDGGDNWEMMENGLPQQTIGRVGLAIAPSRPEVVYALYVGTNSQLHDVYRTEDGGQNWAPVVNFSGTNGLPDNVLGGFGWYFGKIRVNPLDENDIAILGVDLWRSRDTGQSWERFSPPWYSYEVHADKHDMVFTPSGAIVLGTDGGLYRSSNDGVSWEDIENIPTTQFYRVAYNPHQPDNYYGGAQDNGTTGGSSLDAEWPRIYGGDGFQPAFRPDKPNVFYAETQGGGIVVSQNGGQSFQSATNGIFNSDRKDWNMPYIISPHNPDVLYTGTFRVYRSTEGVVPFWQTISGDLTDGLVLNPRYHTITTIDESPLQEGLLYVGTVDANLWRSDNGGESWIDIKAGLPERYITSVKASPDSENLVYVTHSGYKDNDFIPRIHRSADRGASWEDISANLPNLAINDVYIIPGHQDSLLFVATDGGVYGSMNAGQRWERLGTDMPYVQVYDLAWNEAKNELVAGTFARSIMSYALDSLFVDPVDPDTTVTSLDPVAQGSPRFITIYPSPAKDWVRLEFQNIEPGRPYEIAVISQEGRLVLNHKGNGQGRVEEQLDITRLPRGIYTVKVRMKHAIRSGRFAKQ